MQLLHPFRLLHFCLSLQVPAVEITRTMVENGTIGHVNGSNGCSAITCYSEKYNGNRATVVLGAQWGDEGKGKLVDLLAADAKVVCRCQVSYLLECEQEE